MTTLQDQIQSSFQLLWDKVASFLPDLLAAIIILILGWLIASLVGQLIKKVLVTVHLDKAADRLGMDRLSTQVGRTLSLSSFGAWLAKWFIIIVAFVAAANILELDLVGEFLYEQIIPYFGHVLAAVVIMFIGFLVARFLSEIVRGAVKAAGMPSSGALASITRWAIIVFALLAALSELGIAETFLSTLYIGAVAMLALAGGLAFGLGGRDHASRVLDRVERELNRHE